MKSIGSFSSHLEADVARIALEAAGIFSSVVGVGTELGGGASGVQLLVADENFDAAAKILESDVPRP